MDVELATLALLVGVGLVAGFVDSIAGGGGLLALPSLLLAGLDPVSALATNKLQGSFGTASATHTFWKKGLLRPSEHVVEIAMVFVGGGAWCAGRQLCANRFVAACDAGFTGAGCRVFCTVTETGGGKISDCGVFVLCGTTSRVL